MLPTVRLHAQPDFFNFSYNGPSSLPVGPTCSSMLQGNVPDPVVTSTMGFNITMSMFDPIASGFQYSDPFSVGNTLPVHWFVKDDMGHSYTYEYFITFVDVTPPTFDLTGIFDTLEFSSIVAVPAAPNIPVVDNCTPVLNQTFNETPGPDTCESGTFTRTWTATDANNNTATFTQTIIIYKDSLSPNITGYPLDGSASCVQLATAYPAWRALQIANFSASDPSGIKALTNDAPLTFPPGCKIPLMVRFKAVDNCLFQQNVDVIFNTSDNIGPVVVIPPKDTVAYCSPNDDELAKLREWIGTKAYSQTFDSCSFPLTYSMEIGGVSKDSAQVVSAFLASFSNGCSSQTIGTQNFNQVHGLVTVKFLAQDACGNTTTLGIASFGAIDTLRPVITGVNKTEQCGGGNDQTSLQSWINTHGNATVVDDCSDFTWTNFSFSTSTGQVGAGNFNAGPYPSIQANNCNWFADVTFRATDDCGNSNTVTLRWSIVDTLAPTFTGLQPSITVYCPNPLPTVPAATVSDNCDANVSITFSRVYEDSLCAGSYTVKTTWTATDDCGNSVDAIQFIFVRDTTRPVFTLIPANKTFRCDTFVMPPVPVMGVDIMATDVCSPVISITTATVSFQDADPDSCDHYQYIIERTFTALDQCGNTQTAKQTISVIDNLGPVPGGVLDTTALCSGLVPFPAPVPLATDACSGLTDPPTSSGQTITPGVCTDQYLITVHWSAKDVCGNPTNFNQLVHVIDTVPPTLLNIPPNITVECDAIPTPPNVNTFNATDNCDNSAVVNLVETEIRNPDPDSCDHWTNYIVKREWTTTDNCGNNRTYTQLIQIEDTKPPVIIPPSAMMFSNDLGNCGALVTIPAPLSLTDVCSDQLISVVLKDTTALTAPPGSPNNTPVDTVVFQWTTPNLPAFEPVVGNATLTIFIDEADAEGTDESLKVFGESGPSLGNTATTPTQCASSSKSFTIPANQLNNWMSDGKLVLKLAPNGTGGFAINWFSCSTNGHLNRVRANLAYTYSSSAVPIALTYTLDGGAPQNFPPAGQTYLTTGTHTVIYTATDCAGNSATSSVQLTVNDTQAPSLAAPANITAYTGPNNCESTVTLPFPAITENCAMSANLSLASAVMPLQFENDPDVGIVASDIYPALSGLIPNAVGTGILKIRHKGHNAQVGEFFNVYDEAGNFLDTTDQGTMVGVCSTFFETSIPVTAAQINAWAAGGGNTFFALASNRLSPPYNNFVRNCAPLLPNGTDGISQVQVVLEYSYAVVNFTVKKPVNQIVASGTLTGNATTVTLPPANYTVMYTTTDNAGLTGMTSFALAVRDTVKPKAICKPVVIMNLDPGGVVDTLLPGVINNGSFDNCTPTPNLTYSVFPFEFNCKQAGSNLNVTLTVTDSSGNSATCTTIVGVFTIPPVPTYTPVCENGTLQLFANPPSSLPFNYQWSGQNGMFGSNQAEPIVDTNAMAIHNGLYCVTITGGTGCTSSACVQVSLEIFGMTPELESTNGVSFCPGQTINLTTDNYSGSSVKYWWAVDSVPALPGGPILLDTTMMPIFNINNPPPGNYIYYVKVFYNGCNTAYSNPLLVSMHPKPPAAVKDAQILICEGQSLMLQATTPSTGGLTYFWTGPGSFTSNDKSPLVIDKAVKAIHEGVYTLTTMKNGCVSDPVTVTVTINPKPAKPQLSGNLDVCAGQTATLVCNIASAFEWNWTSPSFQTFTTNQGNGGNMWQILNASAADTGYWRVIVVANGCPSDESDPILVRVQQYPVITASSNAPICQDSLLKLTANYASVDPITSWCWTVPVGDPICMVQNPIIPNGSSGIYQVIGATSFGCSATATVSVTIVAPPVIQSVTSDAPPCCNNNTLITFSADVMPTPNSYTWTGPGFANGTAQGANPMLGPTDEIDDCGPFNGQYTLVVKDAVGCPSLPATTSINIQAPPAQPVLVVNPPQPVCAGTNVLITITNPNPEPGATYIWNRPAPFPDTITFAASLSIPNAQAWQSGAYTVTAISGNGICQSGPSETITLTIHPIPATPSISSDSPVCEGETLSLTASTVPGTYNWIGPGFSSQEQNPQIPFMTLAKAGQYSLSVTKDGCTSPSASLTVVVVGKPATPQIATPPEKICIDGPVSTFLNIQSPVNGMEYTWLDAATQIVLQGPSTATSLFLGLPNVLALGPGLHTFQVFATTPTPKACNSPYSGIVTVRFDIIPTSIVAFAGMNHPACIDSAILLTGTPNPLPGMVTGLWTQTAGLDTIIYDATTPNAYFFGVADSVYTFRWSLSNGACTNFSSAEVTITAQMPEIAKGGDDIYTCETTGIQLHATQGVTSKGVWTQFIQQYNLGVRIDDPTIPNTTISGVIENGVNYTFYWEIGNPGCGKSVDPVVVFVYNVDPDAGSNQFICNNNDCALLEATSLGDFESGKWSSPDTTLMFTVTTANTAKVCGLKPGNNIIYWTINNGACGDRSRDTMEVYYEIFPTAVNDFVPVEFGDTAHALVLVNDILPSNYTVAITIPPVNGRILDTLATGVYVYRPQSGYTGMDEMTYRICNTNCPDACSFATVKFSVGGIPECFIPSIITPNGDGFNDQLKIPEECTLGEGAANLEVTIFNQWGDLVFHAKPYLNDWEGTYNNENLPAGTYFYVVKLDEKDTPRTGFLLIQR